MTQSFFALWTKSHCVVKHNDLWHALFCDYLHKDENFNHYLRLIGREIIDMIRRQVKARDTAAIVVTHDTSLLSLMDRVYRLNQGQLEEMQV